MTLKSVSTEQANGNALRKDDETVLMTFPRFCIVEGEDPYPLSRSIVITKSQVEKATQEVQSFPQPLQFASLYHHVLADETPKIPPKMRFIKWKARRLVIVFFTVKTLIRRGIRQMRKEGV